MQKSDINSGDLNSRIKALAQDVPLNILVVDDDELERVLVSDRLKEQGFAVAQASNGQEALVLLAKQTIPVVLVDWQMPVMNGIEFTERLRAQGMQDTYVIMLTMRDSSFDYERGYQAGADDYLTKRVADIELRARIHAGFGTFALRRALKNARAELAAVKADKPGDQAG